MHSVGGGRSGSQQHFRGHLEREHQRRAVLGPRQEQVGLVCHGQLHRRDCRHQATTPVSVIVLTRVPTRFWAARGSINDIQGQAPTTCPFGLGECSDAWQSLPCGSIDVYLRWCNTFLRATTDKQWQPVQYVDGSCVNTGYKSRKWFCEDASALTGQVDVRVPPEVGPQCIQRGFCGF